MSYLLSDEQATNLHCNIINSLELISTRTLSELSAGKEYSEKYVHLGNLITETQKTLRTYLDGGFIADQLYADVINLFHTYLELDHPYAIDLRPTYKKMFNAVMEGLARYRDKKKLFYLLNVPLDKFLYTSQSMSSHICYISEDKEVVLIFTQPRRGSAYGTYTEFNLSFLSDELKKYILDYWRDADTRNRLQVWGSELYQEFLTYTAGKSSQGTDRGIK